MTWHVPPELLVAYEHGRLEPARVMGVEAHLAACAACRAAVPADEAWLAGSWEAVLDVVGAPRRTAPERLLSRLGLPEHRIRLLAAAPALRRSWLAATAAVLAFAVLAARVDGGEGWMLLGFLALAPVLPVLAVATAYGPRIDPLHEITATTPTAGPVLVLWRATAVLVVSLVMGLVAALFLPGSGWLAVAWLLPALCLCLGSLALATAVPIQVAAGTLVLGWLTAVLTVVGATGGRYQPVGTAVAHLFGPGVQLGYLLVAAGAVAVVTLRRRRFDLEGPH